MSWPKFVPMDTVWREYPSVLTLAMLLPMVCKAIWLAIKAPDPTFKRLMLLSLSLSVVWRTSYDP
ncbi:hypothetical protein D3C78_1637670 [compost metagenome]